MFWRKVQSFYDILLRFLRVWGKWPSRKPFLNSIYCQKQFTTTIYQTEITLCTSLYITINYPFRYTICGSLNSLFYYIGFHYNDQLYNREWTFRIAFKDYSVLHHSRNGLSYTRGTEKLKHMYVFTFRKTTLFPEVVCPWLFTAVFVCLGHSSGKS